MGGRIARPTAFNGSSPAVDLHVGTCVFAQITDEGVRQLLWHGLAWWRRDKDNMGIRRHDLIPLPYS
jgi:hypothetical protein